MHESSAIRKVEFICKPRQTTNEVLEKLGTFSEMRLREFGNR
jgi:hypothetical protein